MDPVDVTSVTFDHVKGVEEAKNDLQEVVEFLKNPQKFTALGGKLPKGRGEEKGLLHLKGSDLKGSDLSECTCWTHVLPTDMTFPAFGHNIHTHYNVLTTVACWTFMSLLGAELCMQAFLLYIVHLQVGGLPVQFAASVLMRISFLSKQYCTICDGIGDHLNGV